MRARGEDPPRRPSERPGAAVRVRHRHLRHVQGPARERPGGERVAREACALEVSVLRPREGGAAPPGAMQGRVSGWRRLTHDVAGFDVDLEHPLAFAAGQFALLTVPGIAGARAYSMVNFEPGTRRLSFVVKRKPGGAVSDWLFGDGVDGTGLGVFAPLGHRGRPRQRGHDVEPPGRRRGRPLRGVGRPRLLRRPLRARPLLPRRAAPAAGAPPGAARDHDRAVGRGRARRGQSNGPARRWLR